jgi:hypothetical protein
MSVVATPDVGTLVRERGGKLYVWPDAKACCPGASTRPRSCIPPPVTS